MDSLSGIKLGNPDKGFERLLQFGTQTLSSGGLLGLGDGTDTFLYLDNAGIGVKNPSGGFISKIRSSATKDRIATIADADGKVFPQLVAILAADVANSTTTPAAVSGFSATLEAGGLYEFEMLLFFASAATGTSPRFSIEGPTAQTTWVNYDITTPPAAAGVTTMSSTGTQAFNAWGTDFVNVTNMPAANTPVLFRVRGMVLISGSTPAAPVSLEIWSETGDSEIKLVSNSIMSFRKVN